ncbi:hypothetical protein HEK616_31650 [Streptomyces nigrescens]|uniref:Alpha/beta hydrolase n=1 Tax=Streptomyces nigrescens TaxID=1920 RepID=A0ABN6QXW4_STRNI|nr:hypothetical protein HEK616_31650 [Streptomyces nigrescens]
MILVSHSRGGVTATAAANARPDLIDRIVYVLDVGTSADRAQAATWGRIPKTFVRLDADASLPPAMQDRLIREGNALTPDNPYDVRTLEGSHLKWLIDPAPAARVLGELAALTTRSA